MRMCSSNVSYYILVLVFNQTTPKGGMVAFCHSAGCFLNKYQSASKLWVYLWATLS